MASEKKNSVFSDIVVKKQEQTGIEEDDGFFEFDMRTMKEDKQMVVEDDSDLIECIVPGCKKYSNVSEI